MNAPEVPTGFGRAFVGWMGRSMVCALPSLGWAWLLGFHSIAQVAAMLVVIGGFASGYAWLATGQVMRATEMRQRWLYQMNRAVWFRTSIGLLIDFYTGALVLGLVYKWLEPEGVNLPGTRMSANVTMLVTVLQGILLSAELLLITLLLTLVARGWRRWRESRV